MWIGTSAVLDRQAPTVAITSPTIESFFKPNIQVLGVAREQLLSVTATLSNSTGAQLPLKALLGGASTSPAHDFQVFDVPLALGPNVVSLVLTDLAGNVTITNKTYVLDYSLCSGPPTVQVYWPQDGAVLAADSFALRGWLDDDTASVTAQIVGPDGNTSFISGLVERGGRFWIEGLPLSEGTNSLTLTTTNTVGYSSTNHLSLVKGDVKLTVTDVLQDQSSQSSAVVTGTISDDNYKVWVNGKGALPTGGIWTVVNVPVTPGGTATFAVSAIPLSDNNGDGTPAQAGAQADPVALNPSSPQEKTAAFEEEKEAEKVVAHGKWKVHWEGQMLPDFFDDTWAWNWDYTNGGYAEVTLNSYDYGLRGMRYWLSTNGTERFETWELETNNIISTNAFSLGGAFWPGWSIKGPLANGELNYPWVISDSAYEYTSISAEDVLLLVRTGGKPGVKRDNLFSFTGSATHILPYSRHEIPVTQIQIPAIGKNPGPDGLAYGLLADGTEPSITPVLPYPYYEFNVEPVKHKLRITADVPGVKSATLDPDMVVSNAQFIVGYRFTFSAGWDFAPPSLQSSTNKWDFTGKCLNDKTNAVPGGHMFESADVYFKNTDLFMSDVVTNIRWVSGAFGPPATYQATLDRGLTFSNGQHVVLPVVGRFNMYKPIGKISAWTTKVSVANGRLAFVDTNATPSHGITFSNTLRIPSGFTGRRGWIQVDYAPFAKVRDTNLIDHVEVMNGPSPYGDSPIPFTQFDPETGLPYDEPFVKLPSSNVRAEGSDHLIMWMMFQPDGGVMVPLRAVDWSWHGIATNGPSGWRLTSSPDDHTVNPQDYPTEDYPIWKSSATNVIWSPPF
jgi:hypothetical protein